jgi:hypothetical protein
VGEATAGSPAAAWDWCRRRAQRIQIAEGDGGGAVLSTHPPAPQPLDGGALGGDVEGVGPRGLDVDAEHVVAVDLVAAAHVAPRRRLGVPHPRHRGRRASSGEMTPHRPDLQHRTFHSSS